jgi:glyoxylase-like metal-dependent hydrolase (beta-lactamase superfamily II)
VARGAVFLLLFACAPHIAVLPPNTGALPKTKARFDVCVIVHETRARDLGTMVFATYVLRLGGEVIVIDPAMTAATVGEREEASMFFPLIMGTGRDALPLGVSLTASGIAPHQVDLALITHAHWDHLGGVDDVPSALVLMSADEAAFARGQHKSIEHGVMPAHVRRAWGRRRLFAFDGPGLAGFAASHDVLGDGGIVALPTPGHTPGSAAYLVQGRDRRYLFIGDSAWMREGVTRPEHKPGYARGLFDHDLVRLSETLASLHAFALGHPEVMIVPAHDARAAAEIPACVSRR